jgi:hypothetical protein
MVFLFPARLLLSVTVDHGAGAILCITADPVGNILKEKALVKMELSRGHWGKNAAAVFKSLD